MRRGRTANTDNAGDFPLPGTVTIPAAFDNVPTLRQKRSLCDGGHRAGLRQFSRSRQIRASTGKKNGGKCTLSNTSTDFITCNLAMTHGIHHRQYPDNPAEFRDRRTLVQVFAEDSGTNND